MIDACQCLSFVGCACQEFRIKHEGDPEGECRSSQVKATTHERAAEAWAEAYDAQGDYTIVGGNEEEIEVVKADGSEPKKFRVRGYQTNVYEARER